MMEIMKNDCGDLLQYFSHGHLSNQRQDEGFNRLLKIGGENYKNSRSKWSKTVRIRCRPYSESQDRCSLLIPAELCKEHRFVNGTCGGKWTRHLRWFLSIRSVLVVWKSKNVWDRSIVWNSGICSVRCLESTFTSCTSQHCIPIVE